MPTHASLSSRRHLVAVVLTAAVHVGVVAVLNWGAERSVRVVPPAPAADAPVQISVVELSGSAVVPTDVETRALEANPESGAEPERTRARAPETRARTPSVSPSTGKPQAPAPTPSSDGVAPEGLRDPAEGGSGVFVPSAGLADATTRREVQGALRRGTKPEGPQVPFEDTANDRGPESLGDVGFERQKDGSYRYRAPGWSFSATLRPDGRLEFDNRVTANLSAALLEASGQERFYRAKRQLMERTFALRLSMARRWAKEQIQLQLDALKRQLLEVWMRRDEPATRRRATIFELWDECEETVAVPESEAEDALATELDTVRARAGRQARQTIVSFVRKRLPEGSAHAYSRRELDALNARRRSKQRFEPYRGVKKAPAKPKGLSLQMR